MKLRANKKTSETSQLNFLKRLHRLLVNGYSLIEALEIIMWDSRTKETAAIIIEKLKSGQHLDEAFESVYFHDSIIAYLYFVRINGNLLESIEKSIEMFEHRLSYMKKFKQIIRYPIILLLIFIALIIFIKQTILPSFNQLFQSNANSSNMVNYSIQVIDYGTTTILIFILVSFIVSVLWLSFKKRLKITTQIMIYSKIPFLNGFLQMQTSYYFAIHFSMLLKAAIPIKECLQIMSKQHKTPIISFYSTCLIEHLNRGQDISSLFMQLEMFEEQFVTIFQKNSDSSSLVKDLSAYGELLAENIQSRILRIIMYIQPVFFVVLASSIIFIYIVLMWPMFQLIKTI